MGICYLSSSSAKRGQHFTPSRIVTGALPEIWSSCMPWTQCAGSGLGAVIQTRPAQVPDPFPVSPTDSDSSQEALRQVGKPSCHFSPPPARAFSATITSPLPVHSLSQPPLPAGLQGIQRPQGCGPTSSQSQTTQQGTNLPTIPKPCMRSTETHPQHIL